MNVLIDRPVRGRYAHLCFLANGDCVKLLKPLPTFRASRVGSSGDRILLPGYDELDGGYIGGIFDRETYDPLCEFPVTLEFENGLIVGPLLPNGPNPTGGVAFDIAEGFKVWNRRWKL